jgi:hypothetical protein
MYKDLGGNTYGYVVVFIDIDNMLSLCDLSEEYLM